MSLISPDSFQHIVCEMNANFKGKKNTMFTIPTNQSVANIALKKANIDMSKHAGELSKGEVERIITIISDSHQYKILDYFFCWQEVLT